MLKLVLKGISHAVKFHDIEFFKCLFVEHPNGLLSLIIAFSTDIVVIKRFHVFGLVK